nr:MAG TPA: hypothetical protein [Caudoviricetes sp.]
MLIQLKYHTKTEFARFACHIHQYRVVRTNQTMLCQQKMTHL